LKHTHAFLTFFYVAMGCGFFYDEAMSQLCCALVLDGGSKLDLWDETPEIILWLD
jgi:hypothetical protein